MASRPQRPSLVLVRRPREVAATVLARERANLLCLRGHFRGAAVELEEQRVGDRVPEAGAAIDSVHLHVVEELDAGNRDPELDRFDYDANGGFE